MASLEGRSLFTWFKRSRRQSLREWGLEPADREVLAELVWPYSRMTPEQRRKLEGWVRVFLTERHWEPCGGLELERSMQISIAGQAGLLALGWDEFYFDRVTSILLYPDMYVAPKQQKSLGNGLYLEGSQSVRSGESWTRGPVILSWKEAELGGLEWNEGANVVIHELTHHLDSVDDGVADGFPLLAPHQLARWREVFQQVRMRLEYGVERGHYSVLDPYGLESASELFAVSTEAFFQHADWVYEEEQELFGLLNEFFKTDPRKWGIAPNRA